MIRIGIPLSETDFAKAKEFLARIRPLLASNECTFQISEKNKNFDRQYPMKDNEKVEIIRLLRPEDCVKIEPNNNPRFVDSDVYVFIKNDEIMVYGELELHKLYIKIYLREKKTYDTVIVISFHEEGLHGY